MVLTTFGMNGEGNVIWYPSLYDADSCLGLTNDGELRYGSGIDTLTDNFNTSNSRLWTKLNEAFPDEIQQRYIYMRANGYMTYKNIISYYENIANTVGQTFYNQDARIKYIEAMDGQWVHLCNGSRLEHCKRWVSERITYMDSKFNYGDFLLSATIRSNVTGQVSLKVKTYSPQWVEISFSDSATGTVKKWCDKDKWYTFTNEITNAVDNNITVRGVTNVMYLQGLEDLNVSSLLVSNAKGLCEIDIHGSKRIQRLELGNNVMLQKLNCKNCTNLGYDDNYKVINLEKCINLKYLDLSGTMIGTVELNPDGGALEFLDLSETEITYLTCNYQEYLPEIKLDGCSELSSVTINGCNALTRLSLPNTRLAEFSVTDCNKLDYLDISYTGYLTRLDLTGCGSLTTLKMAGVSNNKFTELDARTLTNLTTLDVSNCYFLENIRFANGYNKLVNANFQQSGIKTFRFGNNNIPTYLDLSHFNLSNVNFYNCTAVEHIKGINLHATTSITPFYNCINLHTIEGNVSLTGALGRSFYNCKVLANLPTLDLSRITSASESFAGCKALTYDQMKLIMSKLSNCTNFTWTFINCDNITHDGWEKSLFDSIPKATYFYYTFSGTPISGQLEQGIFDSLTNLQTIDGLFSGGKVSGYIPSNLFKYNTKLQNVYNLFNGCTGIDTATNISNMFTTTTDLRSVEGLFSGCANAFMRLDDAWFANCPELRNIDYAFNGCKNLIGSIADNPHIIYGKSKLTSAEHTFDGCTEISGDLPSDYFAGCTALQEIQSHFRGCTGLTGTPQTSMWIDCENITNASYLFAGCSGLGGLAGATQEIPKDFYRRKYRLIDISGMWQGCNQLQFSLMPLRDTDNPWFVDCRQLAKINYLFDNCSNLSSVIPERLFEVWDEDGSIMETLITEAEGVFRNCQLLTGDIPANLFEKFIKVRSLSNFFQNCRNLNGGIPDTLFSNCYSLVYANNMFQHCSGIGKYTDEITKESPYFCSEELFWNCPNLLEVQNMFYMYNGWGTSLRGDIPPMLFRANTKLAKINGIFAGCGLLTGGLDGQLFARNGKLENVNSAFHGCSGLRGELSGGLFSNTNNPLITNFGETFRRCSNLTGTAPTLWMQFSNANGSACFGGCTKLDNYADIPDQWK